MSARTRFANIELSFSGYWLSGTGGGQGRRLDAECHRDPHDFPAMPMSQVKGTLRQTAERLAAAAIGGWSEECVVKLFGKRSDGSGPDGALAFLGDATVADFICPQVSGGDLSLLFERVAATRIDEAGVADDRTLRAIEVAVPIILTGRLEWLLVPEPDFDWIGMLDLACAATMSFGALKNDGYGRATARITASDPPERSPAPFSVQGMRRIRLTLRQTERAIFSKRSATEGLHETRLGPTGASILGWVASQGRYGDFDDPFAVFHGGAVRFGDALPVVAPGLETMPTPKLFMRPKNATIPDVSIGYPQEQTDSGYVQYEEVKEPFVSITGAFLNPEYEQRLRTATQDGRARQGQLFGYQSICPNVQEEFECTIEIDPSISEADVGRLTDCLAQRPIRIGKARSSSYGGEYSVSLTADAGVQTQLPAGTSGVVRILLLSDLAICNEFGTAGSRPDPSLFGLGDAEFLVQDSAARSRRYAPWNSHLGCRDIERHVIEAGSVLAFRLKSPLPSNVAQRQTVGLWREAGLGRVWINPSFLEGPRPKFQELVMPATERDRRKPESPTEIKGDFSKWLDLRRDWRQI